MNYNENVTRNSLGFYEISEKPSINDLKAYYQQKYFRICDSYKFALEDHEVKAKKIRSSLLLYSLGKLGIRPTCKFLEIGFGEGFLLDAALEAGFDIKGLDFSVDQILDINENIISHVESTHSPIDTFLALDHEFDVVCMQHVLEHILDPLEFVTNIFHKLESGSLVVVEVPNDFSVLQKYLIDHFHVQSPYWVSPPDHLSYFTEDSLIRLFQSSGFSHQLTIGSFPIEVFLFGEESNYKKYPEHGKSAHQARCLFDIFIVDSFGIDSLFSLYSTREMCQISRSISCIFKKP